METFNREFDGKLLFALHAAERGWQVVIGERKILHQNLPSMDRSVYFSKGFRSSNRKMFQTIAGLGHSIVALDEESLVPASDEMMQMKMDHSVLQNLQMAFVWGPDNVRMYRQVEELKDKPVVPTGNPRIDMMRPEVRGYLDEAIASITERYGRFVLFNSNFSAANHFIANKTRFKVADWVAQEKAQSLKDGFLAHKTELFNAFLAMIPKLAQAVKPNMLVIRPHPSENKQAWLDAAKGLGNVHVIHEGSVVPWLAAADVMVHNGCTSAVEASVIGTPALAYRPIRSDAFDPDLPNNLSQEFDDSEALVLEAAQLVGTKTKRKLDGPRKKLLAQHVAALSGPLACERLLDEIELHGALLERKTSLTGRMTAQLGHAIRTTTQSFRAQRKTNNDNANYAKHKFSEISHAEIKACIERFGSTMNRFDNITVDQLKPNLFKLHRS